MFLTSPPFFMIYRISLSIPTNWFDISGNYFLTYSECMNKFYKKLHVF